MNIDYKLLLEKYICRIVNEEGYDYLPNEWRESSAFTEEEFNILKMISSTC